MRPLLAFLALVILAGTAHAQSSVHTRGYTKKNGTYVAPSHRTSPDQSRSNNWSSKGNVNPYTGKTGHVDPTTPRSHSRSYSTPRTHSYTKRSGTRAYTKHSGSRSYSRKRH